MTKKEPPKKWHFNHYARKGGLERPCDRIDTVVVPSSEEVCWCPVESNWYVFAHSTALCPTELD